MERMAGRFWVAWSILFLLHGCAPETKHKLLQTFFDGVPEEQAQPPATPEQAPATLPAASEAGAAKPPEETVVRHSPYAEGACDSCHESKFSQTLTDKPPALCFYCHDDFLEGKKNKHYPAEEGMCAECHNPHKSKNKFMLVEPQPDLCFTCHDREDILKIEIHTTVEGEECTGCHNPHAE